MRIWRLLIITRFAEILCLPARPAVQALRCRALTAGESICAVRRERKRSASLQKPPQASFQGCQEFIGLINVGGAATDESTAAAAAEQTPGKTVAIAAGASTSTDFPNGQSGTGRLSFRLRRLLRNAKHPDCQCSLRYYMKFRCRGCSLKQSTGLFLYRSRGVETRSLLRKNCRELRHSYAALRDGCVLIRQLAQLLDCVLRWQYRREPSCTRRC